MESDSPAIAKEAILKAKLNELLKNSQFKKELNEQLVAYNDQRSRIKNVADNAQIEAQGTVHIGDKGTSIYGTAFHGHKNVGGHGDSINFGQDFHFGDDYTSK